MRNEDDFFRLDRKGGREKILRATYTPKAFRKRTASSQTKLAPSTIFGIWLLVFVFIFGVAYLADNPQSRGDLFKYFKNLVT